MPRDPTPSRPRPIDDATLREALAGRPAAMTRVVRAVRAVVSAVVAERLRHAAPQQRASLRDACLLGAWHSLTEDQLAALRGWSTAQGIPFEQHVADAVGTWLDAARVLATPSSAPHEPSWTPAMVVEALDDREGPLHRALVRSVLTHLRARAVRTLQSYGGRSDVTAQAHDLAQEFALTLFERDGAKLRGWDPSRGFSSLRGYVCFIGQRAFVRRLQGACGRGVVVPLDDFRDGEPPAPSGTEGPLQQELRIELVFETARARLDEVDRELLALVRRGASAKEGAAALGIAENAYYQRKHRLVHKLRAIMATLDNQER